MINDDHLIFEAYRFKRITEDAVESEDLPTRSHEIIAAIMPKDININGKKNENEFFNKAFPYVVKIIFDGDERRAQRYMYYDEDFNSDLISTYSYFQKNGFPKLREQDVERINRKMHGTNEETPQQYAKDMEKDYTSQKIGSEDAEMPDKDFIKLKQHINKGFIQIKKPTKELPYTHKYINQLAKQDPREGQREDNEERICIEDLAVKHRVSLEEMQKQLEMGIKVEAEHTDNFDIATKIALDHLSEDPNYYTKLSKMEGKEENAEKYVYDNIEVAFNLNGKEYIAYGDVHFGQEDLHGKEEDTVENFGVIDATTKQEVQDDAVIKHGYNAVYNAGVNQSAEENEERRLDPKCWKGYHKQGTKLKGGVRVNNCVKN